MIKLIIYHPLIGSAIISTLVSNLGYSLSNTLVKKDVGKGLTPVPIIFYRGIVITIILFVIAIATGDLFQHVEIKSIIITALISSLSYVALIFSIKALENGPLAVVDTIVNTRSIVVIIIFSLFFSQPLYPKHIIAILLTLVGAYILSVTRAQKGQSEKEFTSYRRFSISAALLMGVALALFRYSSETLGPLIASLTIEGTVLACSFLHLMYRRSKILKIERGYVKDIILMGVFSSIGTYFYTYALTSGNSNTVASVAATIPIISVILGRVLLKEKLKAIQYLAIGITLAGLVIVSL